MTFKNSRDLYDELERSVSSTECTAIVIANTTIDFQYTLIEFDEFLKPLVLENVTFLHNFTLASYFKNGAKIRNCVFADLCILGCGFYEYFILENCVLNSKFEIIDSVFYGETRFIKNDFLGGINLFQEHDSYGSVEFKGGLVLRSGDVVRY